MKKPAQPSADDGIELSPTAPIALVVEDDIDAAQVASGMLRLLGYRSRVAGDANEALYALSEGPPSLILMDICLPVMDGVNLIKVARRVRGLEAVPVVAMSAVYPEEGPVVKVLDQAGVSTFLSKPFTLNGLRGAIDNARGAALKFGPPPAPSMSEIATVPKELRPKPKPKPEPAPAAAAPPPSPEPPPPPTPRSPTPPAMAAVPPEAPAAPSAGPPPPLEIRGPRLPPRAPSSGTLRAISDEDLSFPISDTGDHPTPGKDTKTAVDEVLGSATIDGESTMIIVEKATRGALQIRSPDKAMADGAMVRLEIRHRMAVRDAMQDIIIRSLGHVSACEELPHGHGWRVKVRIAAARPPEAFAHLIDYIERFSHFY